MKLKDGVIIQAMGDSYVALASGEARDSFNGMMRMNETAYFVASRMFSETSKESLVSALLEEYDVTAERAGECVDSVVAEFEKLGLME